MASGKQFNFLFSLKLCAHRRNKTERRGENTAEMRAICIAEYLSVK